MNSLSNYKHNTTFQWEDGIIKEIFHRLGDGNKFCIEFGAWDGKHFSNTWNLWHENGWNALLIEGDPEKCKNLEAVTKAFPKVIPYSAYVDLAKIKGYELAALTDTNCIFVKKGDQILPVILENPNILIEKLFKKSWRLTKSFLKKTPIRSLFYWAREKKYNEKINLFIWKNNESFSATKKNIIIQHLLKLGLMKAI